MHVCSELELNLRYGLELTGLSDERIERGTCVRWRFTLGGLWRLQAQENRSNIEQSPHRHDQSPPQCVWHIPMRLGDWQSYSFSCLSTWRRSHTHAELPRRDPPPRPPDALRRSGFLGPARHERKSVIVCTLFHIPSHDYDQIPATTNEGGTCWERSDARCSATCHSRSLRWVRGACDERSGARERGQHGLIARRWLRGGLP